MCAFQIKLQCETVWIILIKDLALEQLSLYISIFPDSSNTTMAIPDKEKFESNAAAMKEGVMDLQNVERAHETSNMDSSGMDYNSSILTLNEHCLFNIFDRMHFGELINIASTCNQLREKARKFFRRYFKCETIGIKSKKGIIALGPDKKHLKSFLSDIRTLIIYGGNIRLFQFVSSNFKHVKHVRFQNNSENKTKITRDHGIILKAILENVESVAFSGDMFTRQHDVNILAHCQNINNICIETNVFKCGRDSTHNWLTRVYPNLKSVQLNYGFPNVIQFDSQIDEVCRFFTINPTIQHLLFALNIEETLEFIHEYGIKLNKLTIRLTSRDNIASIINLLNNIYARGLIHRFELVCYDDKVWKLARGMLDTLNGLESILMNDFRSDLLDDFPNVFRNLKTLHVANFPEHGAEHLCDIAVNLQELYVKTTNINAVKIFTGSLVALEKISIAKVISDPNEFNWNESIRVRTELQLVRKLSIFLNEDAYICIKNRGIGADQNIIDIKRHTSLIPYAPFPKYL